MGRKSKPQAWGEYLAARLAAAAMGSVDLDATLRAAAWIGRRVYQFDAKHRERAAAHLSASYPQWTDAQVQEVTRGSLVHLAQLAVEVFQAPRLMHADGWAPRVTVGELGPALRLLNAGRPVLMVTGHIGNWEVLGHVLATLGYDTSALARPLDNPLLNDWLLGIREEKGLHIITKWDATDRMLGVIERGGALGFIADQNAGDRGLFVPFFGRLASTYKSIALLALKCETPVVCGCAHRVGPGFRYELLVGDVITPQDWAGAADPLYYITARYTRAIEQLIRRRPDQYLWMHRRWKSRPKFQREKTSPPASLVRQLEGLPWLSDQERGRLLES
jgi:Kdo2-lipid IVA lauroyltransferase/acyltransferase